MLGHVNEECNGIICLKAFLKLGKSLKVRGAPGGLSGTCNS